MSIVTFWGSGKEQVGKTLSVVAIATNMAIEHNKRILIISASYNNDTLKDCYWSERTARNNIFFKTKNTIEIDNGIEGLAKIVQSNRATPSLITDYTKVIFKDRLEILLGFDQKNMHSSEEISKIYSEIVYLAGQYYDMVFVDLDNEINEVGVNDILDASDLVIAMVAQKVSSINMILPKVKSFPKYKTMFLIGKYDEDSKYTVRNLSRLLGEKNNILAMPYNTLYFEAAQEGTVPDLFLKLRSLQDKNDKNMFFINQVKYNSEQILRKIQEAELMK